MLAMITAVAQGTNWDHPGKNLQLLLVSEYIYLTPVKNHKHRSSNIWNSRHQHTAQLFQTTSLRWGVFTCGSFSVVADILVWSLVQLSLEYVTYGQKTTCKQVKKSYHWSKALKFVGPEPQRGWLTAGYAPRVAAIQIDSDMIHAM